MLVNSFQLFGSVCNKVTALELQLDSTLIKQDPEGHRALSDAMLIHGLPKHIRSDNEVEFTAIGVRESLAAAKVKTLFFEPGSPWENGYNEPFNGKLRNELLNGEISYSLKEARIIVE